MAIPNFFWQFYPKTGISLEWPKWLFQIFPDNFSQKDWYKFRMAKNAYSEFIQTFLVQKDLKKFGMAKNGHFEFIWTFLVQKDWKKFGITKIRHSKFIQTCNGM